ncbi:MAG: glycosyltransferase family 1 protein [Burkholderiales bacterium]|nr:glycosyltransferase family 1 protein [Burkholderiales bacterium]
MNILYIAAMPGTSVDRGNAMRRIGHTVTQLDPRSFLPKTAWVDRITWKAGGQFFAPWLRNGIQNAIGKKTFDLTYIDNGEWASPMVLKYLKTISKLVINYNIDDPTGPRDGPRFKAYRQAVPYYDLLVVVRNENISELLALGAKRVIRDFRSADEVVHAPRIITQEIKEKWQSEVLFLGTWMPERGPFLAELAAQGIPLTIIGDNWQKAKEWPILKKYFKQKSAHGDDYAYAIQCAKVNIGLLSKGNRDLHTTRSLEIPSLGGLFCAERTSEHLAMYTEGTEALFWSTPSECAEKIKWALANNQARTDIANAGRIRYLQNDYQNEIVVKKILDAAINGS